MAEASSAMQEIRLPQGAIRYRELGEGEPIVFVHGYLVDGRLWSETAEHLSADAPLHRPGPGRWAPIGSR